MKIDAHQHFWKYDPVRDSWIGEGMAVLQRDFLPPDLAPLLNDAGMDGCIAVQADQSETEMQFLIQLAADYPFIKGVIGWIDLRAENVKDRLANYNKQPVLKGFRHILQDEGDRALMLQPAFKRGITALGNCGYTYDLLIRQDQLEYARQLVAAFPQQLFVLDHLAKPDIKNAIDTTWLAGIKKLAKHSNVYCKVSGMITEAAWHKWQQEDFIPYLDVVTEAFGVSRLLYGSDWPVCLLSGSYKEAYSMAANYYAGFTAGEQAQLFGENAIQCYNLT